MSNSLWPPWTIALHTPLSEISQVRILEWVANPFSRESSWVSDQTQVSCIAGGFFTISATREALIEMVSPIYFLLLPHEKSGIVDSNVIPYSFCSQY